MHQPYYMIDFSASACFFEIKINDYPVIHMNIDGQVSSNIPINYAILSSGLQTISLSILPNIGDVELHPKSEVKIKIQLFDVSAGFVFQDQILEFQSEGVSEKKIPFINYSNTFRAEVPYHLEAWQKGINLKEIDGYEEKLRNAYEKIAILIRNKDFESYKQLISKRENNIMVSMYLSNAESESRFNGLVQDFQLGFEMLPLSKDALLFLYAENKVAMLKKINGEPALSLENKETEEELMLDIAFYIPKGKEDFEVI